MIPFVSPSFEVYVALHDLEPTSNSENYHTSISNNNNKVKNKSKSILHEIELSLH